MMEYPVLLFDGVCNLCNFFVRFILRHEKDQEIRFASLQSDAAKKIMSELGYSQDENALLSVIFISNGKVYLEAMAVFEILKHLKKPYTYFTILKIFPDALNNFLYRLIARNRYSIFGKRDTCMVPDKKTENRFIDS